MPRAVWSAIARAIASQGVVVVSGPSGGGKSTLLKACLPRLARLTCVPLVHLDLAAQAPPHESLRPLIDTLPGPLAHALRLASASGLAEARLLLTPVHHLSTGERARRLIALALHHANGGILVIDEFASNLDVRTARSLAHALTRAASRAGISLLIATTRPSIVPHLFRTTPPTRVHCPLQARPQLIRVSQNP
ncbi:MAG: AAA family ATPase [bacterium]|nr:AAA family ATPase [bacterium]